MASDIDPQSGFRLPLPKREDLDDAGKRIFDETVPPGLQGPAGVLLYASKAGQHQQAFNKYLRFEAGFSPRIREIAILTAAREADSQFEWVQHEAIALREGVEPALIDIIRHRKRTHGLDETEATVIALGRETFGDHRLSAETFVKAKQLFGPRKLIDLVLLMGNYVAMAGVLTAVDMQLRAGQKPLLPID